MIFLLDFVLGVLNRVAPQMQMFFLSLTIKGSLGLLVLLIGFGFFIEQFLAHFAHFLALLRQWMMSVST